MNASLLARLIEAGTPAELVAEVAIELGRAQAEHDVLERKREQDRDRQKRKRSRKVTQPHAMSRDKRDPPIEDHTPNSVSDETGVPPDPAKLLFDAGVQLLTNAGSTEKQARAMVGKWRQQTGDDDEVRLAIAEATIARISDPIPWMTARLKPKPQRYPAEPENFLQFKLRQKAENEAWQREKAAGAGR